jgi:hypothetical protein
MAASGELVKFGDGIAQGAALMTKGNAAVHAARRLLAAFFLARQRVNLLVVPETFFHRALLRELALPFDKSMFLYH